MKLRRRELFLWSFEQLYKFFWQVIPEKADYFISLMRRCDYWRSIKFIIYILTNYWFYYLGVIIGNWIWSLLLWSLYWFLYNCFFGNFDLLACFYIFCWLSCFVNFNLLSRLLYFLSIDSNRVVFCQLVGNLFNVIKRHPQIPIEPAKHLCYLIHRILYLHRCFFVNLDV